MNGRFVPLQHLLSSVSFWTIFYPGKLCWACSPFFSNVLLYIHIVTNTAADKNTSIPLWELLLITTLTYKFTHIIVFRVDPVCRMTWPTWSSRESFGDFSFKTVDWPLLEQQKEEGYVKSSVKYRSIYIYIHIYIFFYQHNLL